MYHPYKPMETANFVKYITFHCSSITMSFNFYLLTSTF